jgi:hypothetical protein
VATFDTSSGDPRGPRSIASSPIQGVALAVDGTYLAIADESEVRVVDVASGIASARIRRADSGSVGLAFTAGDELVVVEAIREDEVWRLSRWTVDGAARGDPTEIRAAADIEHAFLARDDNSLLLAGRDGTFLVALDDPRLAIRLTRPGFSADWIGLGHGSHALIQTISGPQLWDLRAVQPIGAPLPYTYSTSLALRGTGGDAELLKLATAGGVLFVTRQSLDPVALIDRVCQLADRNLKPEEWRRFFPDRDRRDTCPAAPT